MALGDPIPLVADNGLILTSWGDAVRLEVNNSVKKTGAQTMAGSLTTAGTLTANSITSVNNVGIGATPPTAPGHATRKDYVDSLVDGRVQVAGDVMTGNLIIGVGGGTPSGTNDGLLLAPNGSILSSVLTGSATSVPNLVVGRNSGAGGAADAGGRFIRFDRGNPLAMIGSVTIASASSVAYNTTSDPRLKQATGDVDDAATVAQQLGSKVYRGRWIADQGQGEEWVFLNSTDVEPVAPYAVTGSADAVEGGEIVPQQLNHSALVPLLFAALAQALDRIDALEAAA